MNDIIHTEELTVNQLEEESEISAAADDVTHKYTIVPNALIRDKTISPECRWLIIYLLSNKPGWKIKSSQLANHVSGFIGRDKILKIMKEAIEAGYISREIKINRNAKGQVSRTYHYKVASTARFKKCYRHPENQDPENQGPGDQGDKEVLSEEVLSKEKNNPIIPFTGCDNPNTAAPCGANAPVDVLKSSKKKEKKVSEFSAQVKEVWAVFLAKYQDVKPKYRPPKDLKPVLTHIESMINDNGHTVEDILKVLQWVLKDNETSGTWKGWSPVFLRNKNPAKWISDNFLGMEELMNSKPVKKDRKFSPSSDDEGALACMQEMRSRAL